MPIVDIQIVANSGSLPEDMASKLANALGSAFGAAPGRVWVRLSVLASSSYAENEIDRDSSALPTFVRVLHADLPPTDSLTIEAKTVAKAVGNSLGRPSALVHVEYAPPGRGCIAFGGNLLT